MKKAISFIAPNGVNHRPLLDIDVVSDFYRKKDGIPNHYVCSTELKYGGGYTSTTYDIYFMEEPHPTFDNRYFGIGPGTSGLFITNADCVEELQFSVYREPTNGLGHYSRSNHDYFNCGGDVYLDGGRNYTRVGFVGSPPKLKKFIVRNGEFIEDDSN